MNIYQFVARNSAIKTISLLSLLCTTLCLTAYSQERNSKEDRPVRYISSAPKARLVTRRGIRFVKRTNYAANSVVKQLLPTDFAIEKKTFKLINQKRAENGLAALTWSDEAARVARVHSQNMAKHDFFSHKGVNGRMVDQRAIDLGLEDWRSIGENIAFCKGFSNPAVFVVQRWMISPGHRRNLLNNIWRESAVGMAKTKEGKYFFTQIFIVG